MRDAERKQLLDRTYHSMRMKYDLDYRMRKLLNTIRARCNRESKRPDCKYYAGLEVTLTVNDLKTLWVRDNANKMERPTIDREDSTRGYHFFNCRFIEHADNVRRAKRKAA